MAYFSNGTEGMMYEEKYCQHCIHGDGQCTVFLLHELYNYQECNKPESFLDVLIPRRDDGFADECTMFIQRPEGR